MQMFVLSMHTPKHTCMSSTLFLPLSMLPGYRLHMGRRLSMEQMREAARAFGRTGGQLRAKRLTAEQRREIARKAAKARWNKEKGRRD
jgi:hypothetical protein